MLAMLQCHPWGRAVNDDLAGYLTETPYPSGLEPMLTPGWLSTLSRLHGVAAPEPRGAFRMLDIGCGDGLGLAIIAASHPEASFEGIDGLSAHIARGQAFVHDIPNIALRRQTFAEALMEPGTRCDFVTLHGVLAWVTPDVRVQALDLAASRVAEGGLLAVSYNSLPGWSSLLAYQHLVNAFASKTKEDPSGRRQAAHDRVLQLANSGFKGLSVKAIEALEGWAASAPADYFPHEFLNHGWRPLWSAEVREEMASRGLTYVGQAASYRLRPDLSLPAAWRAEVMDEADAGLRDTLFDIAIDATFRIDIYANDARPAGSDDIASIWLTAAAGPDAELSKRTWAGDVRFDNPAARGILKMLQAGPASFAKFQETLRFGASDIRNAAECLMIGGLVTACAAPGDSGLAERVNRRLSAAARRVEGPLIQALAGRCGPVRATAPRIGLLHGSIDEILDLARNEAELRARYFHSEAALDSAELRNDAAAARVAAIAALKRSGVPTPEL